MLPPLPATPSDNRVHWRRYRRLMLWMFAFSLVMVGCALLWMHTQGVVLRLHFMIAMGLGIALSLMLAGALMGLVFVSSRAGIDEGVNDLRSGDVGEER